MHLLTYVYTSLILVSASFAGPVAMAVADADDLVRNSWSAKRDAEADADDLVRNSWSAKRDAEADADADDLVRNSWSA
jgi:hypothetical protein